MKLNIMPCKECPLNLIAVRFVKALAVPPFEALGTEDVREEIERNAELVRQCEEMIRGCEQVLMVRPGAPKVKLVVEG